ncbi:TPA: hypothetical protein IZ487_000995 [Enterococcus faecium]|uniref:Uncharacterized protein n=2 Tax=Enterococcus TaxID=1350 RepID=R2QVP6_9ENTE|nr:MULTISPECIES: hypothetical protein [Enterococcus]HAQ3886337.1 hypothetical protein [Enterococcus faecium]EOH75565.1 hypothetical protein UAK_03209 [Enterococcus raffinosus ATCC 49464]EOT70830.1 hypothetical protein I590_04170 [Enterococcus raffinosus ATCC 49464]PAB00079.1 hypothetical protein AKL21_11015 [Enterococcus canintestini]UXK05187.1 hypothetical protein N7K38_05315 [Enterococcus raffinosus]
MGNYDFISKILCPVLLVILVLGGFWVVSERQEQGREIQRYQQELAKQKETLVENEQRLEKFSKQTETAPKETNNEGLITATSHLFSAVFDYHSDREKESVKARKEQASTFANQQALNGLFPKDADTITPSVTTVSRLEREPEIYLMASEKQEIKALVMVEYSVTIAGSNAQKGTFMYKVSFDPTAKQFTSVKNLGEIHVP